jgi:4-carboxymuconolactone decarboxylase
MLEDNITREIFPLMRLSEMPQDIAERIQSVQDKSGFIPNIFSVLARRPEEFRAFFAYHDALMENSSSNLSKAEKEMIVVATSAINDCQYCVIAHGAILRIRAKNPLIADQVAVNFRKAGLSEKQLAMLTLACRFAESSGQVSDGEILEAKETGWLDEDIWDIGAITAFFAMSNRLANMASVKPNAEFYSMGR